METSRAELLRTLSHDLRTPLTALRLLLEAAERHPSGGLTFDAELADLFRTTVDELTAFAERLTTAAIAARAAND